MSYPVLHIANKIIANTNAEQGEIISNLKLQKLLYYMQGFFIAVFDRKLFENDYNQIPQSNPHSLGKFNIKSI